MQPSYVVKRVVIFIVTLILAVTGIFFLPRISGQNPVREKLLEEATRGGYLQAGLEAMVAHYEQRFGLDKPLLIQYFNYLADIIRLDSASRSPTFPRPPGN